MTVKKESVIQRYVGLSTDTKPTSVTPGSTFLEYDTGDMFVTYDGTNYVPKIERSGYKIKQVSVTKALLASGAYAANDVMSEGGTASLASTWNFQAIGRGNGGYGEIIGATLLDQTGAASVLTTLFLFTGNVVSTALVDNAPNVVPIHTDQAKYVGRIDFPSMTRLSSGDATAMVTIGTTNSPLPLPYLCVASDDDLYGVMVTREAYTHTATTDMIVKLLVRQF